MRVSLIAAVADHSVIGKDNDLIWSLPDDMSFFKASTSGRHVIMGRRNYESIPHKFRPLPGRPNIVMSRNSEYDSGGAALVTSLEDALKIAFDSGLMHIVHFQIYVIGVHLFEFLDDDFLYLFRIRLI